MDLENFAAKWFTLYYSILALLFIGGGGYLTLKKQQFVAYLLHKASQDKPPALFIRILKYLLLFTLPGLVLSFMPFSWIELLFSIWSLILVYIGGLQLVRWEHYRKIIKSSNQLPNTIKRSGAIMVAVGFALLLLAYFVILRQPPT
ncbi:MAG: hypothetical protein ACQEST_03980 [Bacteroidota bacterium]